MRRLPPALAADALRRALRRHPREPSDADELARELRRWLKAARLDRYGWGCTVVDGHAVLTVGARRYGLAEIDPAPESAPDSVDD